MVHKPQPDNCFVLPLIYNLELELCSDLRGSRMFTDKSGPLLLVLGSVILCVEQLGPGLCSNLITTLQSQKASAREAGT